MMRQRRQSIAFSLLLTALLALAFWSHGRHVRERSGAVSAMQALADSSQLASSIESLRHTPSLAGSEEMQITEQAKLIEQAGNAAQMPMDALVRIWPQQSRRVGDSAYKEKPTQVMLRDLTIKQFIRFLHHLTANDNGLRVRSLRLIAPRGTEKSEVWTAEATLTYLIYAPRTDSNTAAR